MPSSVGSRAWFESSVIYRLSQLQDERVLARELDREMQNARGVY